MRLVLTALIDFNDDQDSDQNPDNVSLNRDDGSRSLIDPQSLIEKLKKSNDDPVIDADEYRKGLMTATLRFVDLSFRRHYFDWIYSRYSKSTTNRRRIQRNERMVLLTWAKRFNHEHQQLKILEIEPNVDNHHFMANLKLIGYSQPFGQTSFDFRNALESEYDQDYNQAFIHFEHDESNRLARILETTFVQYIPDADFQFVSQNLNLQDVDRLKPVKFNPKWINQQNQKSEASAQVRLNQIQKTYNSVSSSANSCSASDSQEIAKLNQQLKLASSEQTSLTASKSKAVNDLHSRIDTLNSNKSLTSQSVNQLKRSLIAQLSKTQSHAESYYSSAVDASSRAASVAKQAKALSSARMTQKRLRSKISSQNATNHQLSSQVKTFSSNASKFRKVSKAAARSFTNQLSTIQSSADQNSVSAASFSSRAIDLKQSMSSLSVKLSKTTSLSSLNVATNAKIINDLRSQDASAFAITSNDDRSESTNESKTSKSSSSASVNYTSNHNYSDVKSRSFAEDDSLSFAQSATAGKSRDASKSSASNNERTKSASAPSLQTKGKWGVIKRRNYIPIIIIISVIIIILLILIFPLLRF